MIDYSVSFRDVLFGLKQMGINDIKNEIQLLTQKEDKAVLLVLENLGIDTRQEIEIISRNHRDLNDNVGVGYLFEGKMREDKPWVRGKGCSLMHRVSLTAYQDTSLTVELCKLMGRATDFMAKPVESQGEQLPMSQLSPTWEEDARYMDVLDKIKEGFV